MPKIPIRDSFDKLEVLKAQITTEYQNFVSYSKNNYNKIALQKARVSTLKLAKLNQEYRRLTMNLASQNSSKALYLETKVKAQI